ncbi:MAG: DNA translocase FtsK, partial [Clostridia bacterium]|nr:DNA translocase FtsK [Clostridia bacterium]
PPFDVDTPKKEEKKKRVDYSDYEFPSLDLLEKGTSGSDEGINEEMEENGQKIIETLASFNVLASIKGYDRGPRITRYEVVPSKGVRVNQVVNLFDDIALNLAANGIRIEAPIPGKSAIGFEIPNKVPETVRLRDLLETDRFRDAPSKTLACIGKDVTGSPVFGDIAKMPHVLIAGATGMGKSVCINSILISILYKARPDEVKLILVDPKKVEFKMYNGIPHLLVPVVTDPKQAAGALMWAVEEMERRYDLIENLNVRNIDVYNDRIAKNPSLGDPLPKIIIVIDELNDLMLQVRDPVEGLIMSIAQKARAAGIHLIIGTQRPSVNVITGVIKANIPSRMSCKVTSYQDSKTILEQAGAEKLLDKGDMLYFPSGNLKAERVQSAYVSDNEVYDIMDALRKNSGSNNYDDKVMEDINRAAQKCVKRKDGGAERDEDSSGSSGAGYLNDQQFLSAVELATSSGKIATSLIQRRIGVGYGKAAKFIDIMEDMGIVGPPNGQKSREALITHDEWLEKLSRLEID